MSNKMLDYPSAIFTRERHTTAAHIGPVGIVAELVLTLVLCQLCARHNVGIDSAEELCLCKCYGL